MKLLYCPFAGWQRLLPSHIFLSSLNVVTEKRREISVTSSFLRFKLYSPWRCLWLDSLFVIHGEFEEDAYITTTQKKHFEMLATFQGQSEKLRPEKPFLSTAD